MPDPELRDLPEADRAALARALIRRQGGLSIRIAAAFLALILGLPLLNALVPEMTESAVGGFTPAWLILGVLIYPIAAGLAFAFVARSNRIEGEAADWRSMLDSERGRP